MATTEEVVIAMELRMAGYERDLERVRRQTENAMDSMGSSIDDLARDIRANSSQIGSTFASLATVIAATFSVDKIAQFADGYTRFTNQLKVAGLEGQNLAGVQERLFEIAQQNAVELESVGALYGRASMSARELGASQEQLLQFTRAVSAGLKIQGTSASEAQGAMLQLGQALGGGTVRAEEFNSIVEGMLPIAQAMANNIDAAGGSVARLRTLVNDGKVSSQQAFQAIIAAMAGLEAQGGRTALTIGQAFTQLDNALGKFIGQTDASLGASERFAQGIRLLAENLDLVAKAIATIAVSFVSRYAVGAAAAFVGTSRLIAGISNLALVSGGATASVTTLGVMMGRLGAAATGAGAAMLRAFGGPVGLVITTLAAGFFFLGDSQDEAADAAERAAAAQESLNGIQERAREIAERLATATGRVRQEALAAAEAMRQNAIQMLAAARAAMILAQAKAVAARIGAGLEMRAASTDMRGVGGRPDSVAGAIGRGQQRVATADENVRLAGEWVDTVARAGAVIEQQINAARPPAVNAGAAGARRGGGGGGARSAQDSARERERQERQWLDMLDRARIEERQAQMGLESGIELRAAAQRSIAAWENDIAMRAIDAQEDLTEARKRELRAIQGNTFVTRQQLIDAEAREEVRREDLALARSGLDNALDLARAQQAFAETREERLGLELRMLDLQHAAAASEQTAIAENEQLSERTREAARARLAVLEQLYGLEQRRLNREAESPGARLVRQLGVEGRNLNDRFEAIAVDGLESLNDGLVDAIRGVKDLGDVFGSIADQIIADLLRIAVQRAIIEPLANALFGGRGGGGGGDILGSIISLGASLFGGGGFRISAPGASSPGGLPRFASGGSMMLGGSGGIDRNLLSLNGQPIARVSRGERMDIVPPGATSGLRTGGGAPVQITLEVTAGEYFDARVTGIAGPLATDTAVKVVRAAAPGIAKVAEATTFRALRRPGISS